MINYFEKNRIKKYLLIASYLLFYLLSLSLTAIIGLLIVLLVYVIGLKNRSAKQKLFIIFSFLVFSFSIPLIYEYFSDEILYSQDKFESQTTDSSSYGVTFNYIFSPSTFFGDGLLKAPNGGDVSFSTGESSTTNSLDIGIIPFINFLWFYSVIIFFSFHTSFKNKEFGFIGLILIYIIFHSMKFPFHVFHYPIVFLFYFILSVVPKDSEIIT